MDDSSAPSTHQVVEMALAYFARVGEEVTLTDEGLTTGDGRVFGLEPLRRRLAGRPPEEWPEGVDSHFDTLLAADPTMPGTFAEASPNLRSAVISEADMGLFEGAIMERHLVDGLGERLMLRRGSLGMTVTRDTFETWEVDAETVWKTARNRALQDEPVHTVTFRVDRGTHYLAVRGGRWTSTRALAIDGVLGGETEYGALVAVPARDEVLVHRIRDEGFTDATLAMLSHAVSSFVESPLPVGCDLFWWSEGRLARICTPGEDRYRYIRVPEFSAMLWRLEEATGTACRRLRRA
jgi:hypothetical protein